jgi:hypothetical protein
MMKILKNERFFRITEDSKVHFQTLKINLSYQQNASKE